MNIHLIHICYILYIGHLICVVPPLIPTCKVQKGVMSFILQDMVWVGSFKLAVMGKTQVLQLWVKIWLAGLPASH